MRAYVSIRGTRVRPGHPDAKLHAVTDDAYWARPGQPEAECGTMGARHDGDWDPESAQACENCVELLAADAAAALELVSP